MGWARGRVESPSRGGVAALAALPGRSEQMRQVFDDKDHEGIGGGLSPPEKRVDEQVEGGFHGVGSGEGRKPLPRRRSRSSCLVRPDLNKWGKSSTTRITRGSEAGLARRRKGSTSRSSAGSMGWARGRVESPSRGGVAALPQSLRRWSCAGRALLRFRFGR
jgi:hypothetical protein